MQSMRQVIGTLFARRSQQQQILNRPSSYSPLRQQQAKNFLSTTDKNNKKMAHFLAGQTLVVNRAGDKRPAEEYLKGKVVALYFSAMWCPPCRAFTPVLKKYYETLKAAGKNFEVVFVSRDRDEESLVEYYKDHHAEWTYLEFGNPKISELLEKYEVRTIPTLRVVKPDGTVSVGEGRNEVAAKGENALELFDEWSAFYEV